MVNLDNEELVYILGFMIYFFLQIVVSALLVVLLLLFSFSAFLVPVFLQKGEPALADHFSSDFH